ncbi:MAG: ATP-binding protein, partial [Solirubrobacterales bacterium]|nr:ATP-binding protein [Solirubrobacterales bacterium]
RYVYRNILLGRGDQRAALYWLPTVSYGHLSDAGKRDEAARLSQFAYSVRTDFALWRVCRMFPIDSYTDDAMELVDARHQDEESWERWLEGHTDHLRQLRPHSPEVYVAISLQGDGNKGSGGGAGPSFDRIRRRAEDLLGVSRPQPVGDRELAALAEAELEVFNRLRESYPDAERADERDTQWLLRRLAFRGTEEPSMDAFWQPDAVMVDGNGAGRVTFEPLEANVVQQADLAITAERRHLIVDGTTNSTLQTVLAIGALPHTEFPTSTNDAELLFSPLEALDFPVDAVVHARWLSNADALSKVRRGIVDVENKFNEQMDSQSGPGWLDETDRELARELEAYLQSEGHPPILLARMSLALAAPDQKELRRRITAVREKFGHIALYQPAGLQMRLWELHIPQPPRTEKTDYVEPMTIERFGAMMPLGGHGAGSANGAYIGYTTGGGRRPVRWNPLEASRELHASPAMLLAGRPGSGKTIAAQLLGLTAAMRGSLVVDIDPKPDHNLHEIPELADRSRLLELTSDVRYAGVLDPMRIVAPDWRVDTATSYFLEMLREKQPGWESAIEAAVHAVNDGDDPSSMKVLDMLRDGGHDECAEALERVARSGIGRLGFGDGEFAREVAQVSSIRIPGLVLPAEGQAGDTYSYAQRRSVATIGLLADFALYLISQDSSRHKVVLFDEAWFLLASPQGRNLLNRLMRLGRAQNATVIVATQRLGDLGELTDLIGTYLIFGQHSDDEARRGLSLLGLDATNEGDVAKIRGYERGLGLIKDLRGRVAEMQIDVAFPEVLEVLDTSTAAAERRFVAAEEEAEELAAAELEEAIVEEDPEAEELAAAQLEEATSEGDFEEEEEQLAPALEEVQELPAVEAPADDAAEDQDDLDDDLEHELEEEVILPAAEFEEAPAAYLEDEELGDTEAPEVAEETDLDESAPAAADAPRLADAPPGPDEAFYERIAAVRNGKPLPAVPAAVPAAAPVDLDEADDDLPDGRVDEHEERVPPLDLDESALEDFPPEPLPQERVGRRRW